MLEREIVLITGAGRGIGAAAAAALAQAGARVAVSARKFADAEAVAARLPAGKALAFACDVADPAAVTSLLRDVEAGFGAPTVVVNNAGVVSPIGLLHEVDPRAWAASLQANLAGAAAVTAAALPAMLAAGRGRIVNLSSGAAHRPLEGWSAYCSGKAGLAMLTRAIALEYAARGILAFGFSPGVVDTGMQGEIRASGINPVSQIPRKSLADPAEPAAAIAFLCTPAADGFAGGEVDIRDPAFRSAAGLPALPEPKP